MANIIIIVIYNMYLFIPLVVIFAQRSIVNVTGMLCNSGEALRGTDSEHYQLPL